MTKEPSLHSAHVHTASPTPEPLRVAANGLDHHVLEWSPTLLSADDRRETVLLLHGYMDAAGTWDRVAPAIAARGFRVLAPDMRGFGDGPAVPRGSYYHFNDYVADVAALIDALAPGVPVSVVGHSMGGMIGLLYAGTFPERVARLANLEGLGPPDNPFDIGPTRMRKWLDDLRDPRSYAPHPPMPLAEARRRLVTNHPRVPVEVLEHRLPHLVREVEGGVVWRFDPLHRTTSPSPFFATVFLEFARRIACPVLFVSGGSFGYHPPDEAERLAAFRTFEQTTLEGAGHMLHWTAPDELAQRLLAFFGAAQLPPRGRSSPFL